MWRYILLFIISMKNISFLAYWITSRERRNNEGEVSKPMVKLLKIKSSHLDKKIINVSFCKKSTLERFNKQTRFQSHQVDEQFKNAKNMWKKIHILVV